MLIVAAATSRLLHNAVENAVEEVALRNSRIFHGKTNGAGVTGCS